MQVDLSYCYNAYFISISNNGRNQIVITFGDAYNSLHTDQLNYGIEDSNDVYHINSHLRRIRIFNTVTTKKEKGKRAQNKEKDDS